MLLAKGSHSRSCGCLSNKCQSLTGLGSRTRGRSGEVGSGTGALVVSPWQAAPHQLITRHAGKTKLLMLCWSCILQTSMRMSTKPAACNNASRCQHMQSWACRAGASVPLGGLAWNRHVTIFTTSKAALAVQCSANIQAQYDASTPHQQYAGRYLLHNAN